MTTWIVDVLDKVGQRVLPSAESPQDRRFRKVRAETFSEALWKARNEVRTLGKLDSILAGQEVVMSDKELDWLIDHDLHPVDVVSMHNPGRVGILDAYLVGKVTCPTIRAFRALHGLELTEEQEASHAA